jgi:hypothetical protein
MGQVWQKCRESVAVHTPVHTRNLATLDNTGQRLRIRLRPELVQQQRRRRAVNRKVTVAVGSWRRMPGEANLKFNLSSMPAVTPAQCFSGSGGR